MKKMFFLTLLVFPAIAFCQDSAIIYRDIVAVDNAKKSDLHRKAKFWFVNTFKDTSDVIKSDMEDQLVCNGTFTSFFHVRVFGSNTKETGIVKFSLSIIFKDGKYKAEMYGLSFHDDLNSGIDFNPITSATGSPIKPALTSQKKVDGVWQDLKNNINEQITKYFLDLKTNLSKRDDDF